MIAAYFPDSASFRATSGTSNDPGTHATSIRSSPTPCRMNASPAAGEQRLGDHRVEPRRDDREPAGGGGEVAFEGGHESSSRGASGGEDSDKFVAWAWLIDEAEGLLQALVAKLADVFASLARRERCPGGITIETEERFERSPNSLELAIEEYTPKSARNTVLEPTWGRTFHRCQRGTRRPARFACSGSEGSRCLVRGQVQECRQSRA